MKKPAHITCPDGIFFVNSVGTISNVFLGILWLNFHNLRHWKMRPARQHRNKKKKGKERSGVAMKLSLNYV